MKSTDAFKQVIQSYLENRAKEDALFSKSYAKENKTIDECINYIFSEVQKSGCNGFADEEIYSMAVHYYDEDNIKDVNPINATVVVNHKVDMTAKADKVKETAKEVSKPAKPKVKSDVCQMDLFGML